MPLNRKNTMKVRAILLAVAMLAVNHVCSAQTWIETFPGFGNGDNKNEGCDAAALDMNLATFEMTACLRRGGLRQGKDFKNCRCRKVSDGMMCQVDMIVSCSKGGGAAPSESPNVKDTCRNDCMRANSDCTSDLHMTTRGAKSINDVIVACDRDKASCLHDCNMR
jgi:hypothetical protein